jgi:pyridoxamine 5'-phosphate oxidase
MSNPENTLSDTVASLRLNYSHAELRLADTPEEPRAQFHRWLYEAIKAQVIEPNAMTLSTCGSDGRPSSRTVLLKGLADGGLSFYTNYSSRKAQEIEENANVAVLFLWKELQRQVSIIGQVKKASREESEAYFHSRPYGSQIGAWVSTQSVVIPNREWMEGREKELKAKYPEGGSPVPLPEFWGGYNLFPVEFEFWQGRESRLHDRICYTKLDDGWKRERLSP